MPKILTFTANLLAETTYYFGDWKPSTTQRSQSESFQVGGKGLNVSKMLNRLGAYNETICFPGGYLGPRCQDWLDQHNIRYRAYTDGCESRGGTVVRSERIGETTFLGQDSIVSPIAIQQCVAELETQTNHVVFAICGSIQNWTDKIWDPLRAFIENRPVECHLVIDTYGPALEWFVKQQPELVKINRQELESLAKPEHRDETTEALLARCAPLAPKATWIITDGGNSIWFQESAQAPFEIIPPETTCVSATGCGDVFFATYLDAAYNRKGITTRQAVEKAADFAARNAAKPSIAEFALD